VLLDRLVVWMVGEYFWGPRFTRTTLHRQAVALSFSVALCSSGSAPLGLTAQTTVAHGYRVVNVSCALMRDV
jgi:hypothetical protein